MRIVAKIGTSSITDSRGHVNLAAITKLTSEIAGLRADGHHVLLVSSGAVAAGVATLGFAQRPTDMLTLQAVSAVGQSRFMRVYNDAFAEHGLIGAQVLVDPHDFVDRTQYLHARDTLGRLLDLGCIPIINENDAIANDELRYGDNDRIAALVAHAMRADVLVLMTDLDGLYTADPRTSPDAELVPMVDTDNPLLSISATVGGSGRGSGGMASKLTAARMASWSGVRTVICRAEREQVLVDAVHEACLVGTTFAPHSERLSARKLWIAFATESRGTITVDDGARAAVSRGGRSLLPAGVTAVSGTFAAGDVIDLLGADRRPFARGVAACAGDVVQVAAGRRTAELPDGVNHVVHCDDLVILPFAV